MSETRSDVDWSKTRAFRVASLKKGLMRAAGRSIAKRGGIADVSPPDFAPAFLGLFGESGEGGGSKRFAGAPARA